MALSMNSREDNVKAHAKAQSEARQKRFDEAMQVVDGDWDEFFNDSSVSDDTKVAAAELLTTMISALVRCTSPDDVKQLKGSFEAIHNLSLQPELVSLMQAAERLDPSDQAILAKSARRANDGSLEIRTDGTVIRPRRELPSSDQAPAPREQPTPSQPARRPQQPAQPVASQPPAEAPRTSEESSTQPQPATPPAPQPTPPSGSGQKQEKKPGLLKRARARGEQVRSKLTAGDDMGNA